MKNTLDIHSAVLQSAHEAHMVTFLEAPINAAAKAKAAAHYPEGNIMRMLLGTKDVEKARQEVLALAKETDWDNLIPKESELRSSFDQKNRLHLAFLQEALNNIDKHREEIGAELLGGATPTQVLSLTAEGADSHNGSRHTIIVETDAGTFLYKPHSLQPDKAVKALCQQLFPDQFLVPAVIDCGSFGFCQYVTNVDPKQGKNLDAYFTSLGTFCALAHFLSISDLHAENFLASGSKLVPIDLETVLSSPLRFGNRQDHGGSFATDLRNSALSTSMVSCGKGVIYGAILAGTEHKIQPMSNCGNALEHKDAIIRGFTSGFQTCLANKELIIQAVKSLEGAPIRILIENTRYYGALQKRVFGATQEKQTDVIASVDAMLRSKKRGRLSQKIMNAELKSIMEGDIPYFFMQADQRHLLYSEGILIEDYLDGSPIHKAIDHIQMIDEADRAFQTALLSKAIENMPLMGDIDPVPLTRTGNSLTPEDSAHEAGKILEQLHGDMTPGVDSLGGLWAAKYGETHKSPMNVSLATGYAGAGVFAAACLATQAGSATHAKTILNICLHELRCFVDNAEANPQLLSGIDCGLSDGLGGLLKSLHLIWRYTQSKDAREIYSSLLSLVDALDLSDIPGCNVYNGLGGLLLSLAHNNPELPVSRRIGSIADELLSRGVRDQSGHRTWTERDGSCGALGYGKGNGGIGMAFLRAWQTTGDPRFWEACCDAIAYESENYSEELGFWPLKTIARGKTTCAPGICRGISGQALVFATAAKHNVPTAQTSLERAQRCISLLEPELTDNLCCGTASLAEGYLALGMQDEAGKLLRAQVQRKESVGHYIHESSKRKPYFNPSLFFGCLGVGYQLLRYADSDTVSSLFL